MSSQHTNERLVLNKYGGVSKGEGGDTIIPSDASIPEADKRRVAACWNAFNGVNTEKIEGKTVAEYVCGEAYLQGMNPVGGSLEMGLSGIACQIMAESFAGQFVGSGAVNFIEVGMSHEKLGPFTVTVQRAMGETPAQQKAAALRELAAARALLREAASATIGELQSLLPKIRSYLDASDKQGGA